MTDVALSSKEHELKTKTLGYWISDKPRLPLLDLRKISHRPRSVDQSVWEHVVHIPINEVSNRSFELPPRNVTFAIMMNNSCDCNTAASLLIGRKPWKIEYAIILDETEATRESSNDTETVVKWPLPRLWEPDSMVKNILLPLLQERCDRVSEIWDLGAGAGRDVCFLAESLPQSAVVAFDHRYRQETDPIHAFFQRRRVDTNTRVSCIDVTELKSFSCQCLFMVRYWNLTLAQRVALEAHEGTLIAISHFGKPHQGAEWPFKHPKERHVLERDQLSQLFRDWNIIYDKVSQDSDHGRTLIQFVAEKPSVSEHQTLRSSSAGKRPWREVH